MGIRLRRGKSANMKNNQDNWEIIIENGVDQILKETYRDIRTDGPWSKIGDTEGEKELTDEDRKILLQNSRDRYFKTPEGRSLIESAKHYIIGKGIVYNADDENPQVQEMLNEFWNHPRNIMELRQKEIVTRALRDGEVFIRFFEDSNGMSYLRFIEPEQIVKIETALNDAEEPIKYHRQWTPKDEHEEQKEQINAEDIVHIKLGVDLSMSRGRPYIESIMKRLIQLEQFVEGRIRKNRIGAGYILEKVIKGPAATAEKVSSIKDGMSDATKDSGVSISSKKMPKFGSVVVHNENIEYKWCKPDIKADDSKEDGRLIKLSICAGVNAPEYLLSDASNANYASTMVAESPYVRSMEDYQDTFEIYFQIILRKVIERLIKRKTLPATSTETIIKERAIIRNLIPRAKKGIIKKLRELLVDKEEKKPIPTKTSVSIEFPPMIHRELKQDSEALQIHSAMGWVSNETASGKFGYNYAEEQKKIANENEIAKQDEEQPNDEEFEKKREDEIEQEEENGDTVQK